MPCPVEHLDEVFEGMFYIGEGAYDDSLSQSVTGRHLYNLIDEIRHENGSDFHQGDDFRYEDFMPVCYDAVAITVLALHKTEQSLIENNQTLRLSDFPQDRAFISNLMVKNLKQTDYYGFKGRYRFHAKSNDPVFDYLSIFRDIGNARTVVYRYFTDNDTLVAINDVVWQTFNRNPPKDRTRKIVSFAEINSGLKASVSTICLLAMVTVVGYSCFVMHKLTSSRVRRLSPKLLLIMLVGCLFIYLHLTLWSNDPMGMARLCQARIFFLIFGLCLLFGGLFMKTFRVFLLYTRIKSLYFWVKDSNLIYLIFLWTGLNLGLLICWFAIGNFDATEVIDWRHDPELDLLEQTITLKCTSKYQNEFLYVFFSLQGAILVFGSFIAFCTRNIEVGQISDESKQIGLCVYITTLSAILVLVLT